MNAQAQITTLFLDIGGVLLTNGWDHNVRMRTAKEFGIDFDEMDERHHPTFDTHEEGKLNLDEHQNRVFFTRGARSHGVRFRSSCIPSLRLTQTWSR